MRRLIVLFAMSGCFESSPARYQRAVVVRTARHVSLSLDSPSAVTCHQACLSQTSFRDCLAACDGAMLHARECPPPASGVTCQPFFTQETMQVDGRCDEFFPLQDGQSITACRHRLIESASYTGAIVLGLVSVVSLVTFGYWVSNRTGEPPPS